MTYYNFLGTNYSTMDEVIEAAHENLDSDDFIEAMLEVIQSDYLMNCIAQANPNMYNHIIFHAVNTMIDNYLRICKEEDKEVEEDAD